MSSQTPNLNLVLPIGTEHVSRQIINENNTKIDTSVGSNTQAIANLNGSKAITVSDYNDLTTTGVYKARKITQTVSISGKTANPGEQISFTGSLKGGDFVDGTFNVSTKTFTATV